MSKIFQIVYIFQSTFANIQSLTYLYVYIYGKVHIFLQEYHVSLLAAQQQAVLVLVNECDDQFPVESLTVL